MAAIHYIQSGEKLGDNFRRLEFGLVIALAPQVFRSGMSFEAFEVLIVPAVLVSMIMWCFGVLRRFGYSLERDYCMTHNT